MYFVFTRMPGESYRRRLRSLLLCSCDVLRAPINSLCLSSSLQETVRHARLTMYKVETGLVDVNLTAGLLEAELRSCVKVEVVADLCSPPLTVRTVSVNTKQH